MKTLRLLLCLLCVAAPIAQAATRTASVTGNWTNTVTWGGNPAPVTGDSVNVNGDVVVTIDSGTSAASGAMQIGQTNNTTGFAELIVNGTLTMDAGANLRVGGTAVSRDGILTIGPGATIVNTTNLVLNFCKVRTTTVSNNWGKVTGAGGITTLATGPRQNVQCSYVSFQNSGTVVFNLQDTTGAFTSALAFSHCTFPGWKGKTWGSTDTPNTCPQTFDNCDFQDCPGGFNIINRRASGGSQSNYYYKYCTFNATSGIINFAPTTSEDLLFDHCVFRNASFNNGATSGGMTFLDCLHDDASGSIGMNFSDSGKGCISRRAYHIAEISNSHIGTNSGSGGTGQHEYDSGVMDAMTTESPDLVLPGANSLSVYIHHLLIVQCGVPTACTSNPTFASPGLILKNNTLSGTISPAVDASGGIYIQESTVVLTGGIHLANCLHRGNLKASETSIQGNPTTGTQHIDYSDYNSIFNVTTAYLATKLVIDAGNTSMVVPGGHDIAADPLFFDSTRTHKTWDATFGSGLGTTVGLIGYFLKLNGYRGTPNFDQGGTPSANPVSQMYAWVRAGYAPTNLTLRGAGDPADGSPDIGAIPVLVVATGRPDLGRPGISPGTQLGGDGLLSMIYTSQGWRSLKPARARVVGSLTLAHARP